MSFASRLKEQRERNGFTQSQLARLLGVSQGAVGNYETGISSPKADILYKVFDILHCDANYLFQDEMDKLLFDHQASPEEMEKLIKKYRTLDEHGKKNVDTILDNEYERCNSKREPIILRDAKAEPEVPAGFRAIPTPQVDTMAASKKDRSKPLSQESMDEIDKILDDLVEKNRKE